MDTIQIACRSILETDISSVGKQCNSIRIRGKCLLFLISLRPVSIYRFVSDKVILPLLLNYQPLKLVIETLSLIEGFLKICNLLFVQKWSIFFSDENSVPDEDKIRRRISKKITKIFSVCILLIYLTKTWKYDTINTN